MGFSDDDWWERGLCRDMDPDTFERPAKRHHRGNAKWTAAKAACAACPVQAQCLEYVLDLPEGLGPDFYAAGCTPEELQALRKRRRR